MNIYASSLFLGKYIRLFFYSCFHCLLISTQKPDCTSNSVEIMHSFTKVLYIYITGLNILFLIYLVYLNNNFLPDDTESNGQLLGNTIQQSSIYDKTLRSFLSSTARNLLNHKPPEYLRKYKNPCFKVPYSLLVKIANVSNSPGSVAPDESCVLCLPTVYHVGVCKTGSTDFHARVSVHQDVYESHVKEPVFFSSRLPTPHHPTFNYTNWTYTVINYAVLLKISSRDPRYSAFNFTGRFNYSLIEDKPSEDPHYGQSMLLTDSTPFYASSLLQSVPKKIKHFVPQAKIIFSVRDPVERMLSEIDYFVMQFKDLWKKLNGTSSLGESLHERILHTIETYKECKLDHSEETCTHSYTALYPYYLNSFMYWISRALRHSMYHLQLKKYLLVFPREDILVVDMHDYTENPMNYIEHTVLPFLGLGPYNETIKKEWSKQEALNKNSQVKLQYLLKTKHMLAYEFKEMSEQFSAMLGGRQFSWYSKPLWQSILNYSCFDSEVNDL